MTTDNGRFSEAWVAAAEQADRARVHGSADCRRGASGSVWSDDGLIVTTARAVAGRERLELVQGDARVAGTVIGYDAATDLGLVRGDSALGKAPAWSAEPVKLGALLLAGSRPGRSARVRLGLVSQVGAAWHTQRGGRVERYVETDLAPEPGFSGGLVFDAVGRAAGMNSAGLLRGVPLVLEKGTLDRVVTALLAHGRVRRGYLGVGTQAVRLPDATARAAAQGTGLLVSSVQVGSAAEAAGLMLGDVLLKLSDAPLTDAAALQAALEDTEGQQLSLGVLRAGQVLSVDLTPGARS
jgi:S1-C subfamily serine protease